ncbi:MAG: alpha/beta hydrolase [Ilumatobacter sp.]|uniref:alpha/beta fold hydrolase n=1 Tax=Ilumatobacter sp. TaxID=1967498 RepID=UPI00262903AB|nr:alpha/beta hydrolase [Ilumatobacter sp.]MDJ0769342.1 alpha/beta hydrolase [Ilumatobacter sp.]
MVDVDFTTVSNGDIEIRVASKGSGPLMLFVHGWPELWYSWRHQMEFFAGRGFTSAALDVRGYGGSSKPADIPSYRLTQLCGDVAAVIDDFADGPAIVVGHDWGAPIAWNTARLHPDRVRAVAGLSVPYVPVGPVSSLELWKELYADRFFYQTYFQEPGVAEAELGADNARSLRLIYYAISGDGQGLFSADKPADATMLEDLVDPDPFPAWMSPEDLQVYVEAFDAGGWTGPLNRYRAQGLDADELGSRPDPELTQPAVFVAGALDGVRNFVPGVDVFEMAGNSCADFRGATIIDGIGHWVQQEAPAETNAALAAFVDGL